jgi:hypothetical protein
MIRPALVRRRGAEAAGVDAVGDERDFPGRDAGLEELVADRAGHRDKGVAVAQQQVAGSDPGEDRPARPAAVERRAPRVDLARPLAVDLGLQHDALAQRARGQQRGQAQHPCPADDDHVISCAQASERRDCRRHHRVLPRPGCARGAHAHDADAVDGFLGRPARVAAARDHGRRRPGAGEGAAEPQDVLLPAAEHGVEGLGEEEDRRQRTGSAGSRSAAWDAGWISFTTYVGLPWLS